MAIVRQHSRPLSARRRPPTPLVVGRLPAAGLERVRAAAAGTWTPMTGETTSSGVDGYAE